MKKNNTAKFIVTLSEDNANLLLRSNFRLINHDGKMWTFLNEPQKMTFTDLDHTMYTDQLLF